MNHAIRILYVDDYPFDRELVRDVLTRENEDFVLVEAASRPEFEAALANGGFDLVLSDFNILGFEGLQVLDAVRARDKNIPVIIVTGTGSEEIAVEAMKRGAADYVIKTPKHIRRLPMTIHAALEKKRVEHERALDQARLRYQAHLLENVNDAVLATDENQILTVCNRAAEELYGWTTDEALGKPVRDVIRSEITDAQRAAALKTLQETGRFRLEVLQYHRNGNPIWVDGNTYALRDDNGNVTGFVAVNRDITERVRAANALRESEKKYSLLFNKSAVPTILFKMPDVVIADVNEVAEALVGYTRGEMIGKTTLELGIVRDVNPDEVKAAFEKQGALNRDEMRIFTKAGQERIVVSKIFALEFDGQRYALSTMQDITERKRAEEKNKIHLLRLATLREIDLAINSSADLKFTLDILTRHVLAQLGVDAAAILLLERNAEELRFAAGAGFRKSNITELRLKLGADYSGKAALERKTIVIRDLTQGGAGFRNSTFVEGEGFVTFYAVPLIAKGKVRGVLELFHRSLLNPDQEWLDFMNALAGRCAIAIDNAEMFAGLQRYNAELVIAYDATIEGWTRALDLRDKETEGHTQRVTEMTMRLGRRMGLSEEELVHVRRGALLHDIGKIGVPDSILHKPGKLTEEEWAIIRKHPQLAYDMLAPIAYLRQALDIPYCHHEKWDGTGYPRGLRGEQIPFAARLFAIVDVWDALRSARPYRPAWSDAQVREYLRAETGKHFDPRVVQAMLAVLAEQMD